MHTFAPRTRRLGFTIIELLVTLVIISLLVSVATASFLSAQLRSRDNVRKGQVNALAVAVENYYSINQKFPGKINKTIDPNGDTDAHYNSLYKNCQTLDIYGDYVYYYYPFVSSDVSNPPDINKTPCSARPAYTNPVTSSVFYNPTDYKPYPAWIPGLAPFLNPFTIETRYLGQAGATDPTSPGHTGEYGDIDLIHANNDGSNGKPVTRTFVYRKLVGGYTIYAHLETDVGDKDAVTPGTTYPSSDKPALPADIQTVDGKYIYMVRK